MKQPLKGRVALVTGAGRGLGRDFAISLAQAGMRVAVTSRTAVELDETVARISATGGEAVSFPADVTDTEAVEALVQFTESQLGPVDLLVNNAGTATPFGPTWETDANQWWRTLEINLKGALLCGNAVIPGMIGRGTGRIVNVCSGAGTYSIPYMSAYVTSKTALIRLTEVLADELRDLGVAVFGIQPGTVRTALVEDLLRSEAGARWLPWFQKIFDEGRDVSSQAACELVLYLASGEADALSGRYFSALTPPADVVRHATEIRAQSLHVLRMQLRKPGSGG